MPAYIAVDLGATSGRVILGILAEDGLKLEEMHRFPNEVRIVDGRERWDINGLFDHIKTGIKNCAKSGHEIASIGVDTWGVDYGFIDEAGELIEDPVFYRDERARGERERLTQSVTEKEIYDVTGIQFMDINTIFHLTAQKRLGEWPEQAKTFLMIPDILHYFLSGVAKGEYSNATTTQLLDVRSRDWSDELIEKCGLPRSVFPELTSPISTLGEIKPELQKELGLDAIKVVVPATHDTGSAVLGTPLDDDWAYLSSGTWSLVGLELPDPVVSDSMREANITNEGGVGGTIRLLKNVMGMWLLESCRRIWEEAGTWTKYEELVTSMSQIEGIHAWINPDDQRFLNPDNMVSEIQAAVKENGYGDVEDNSAIAKVIFDSLAMRYASVLEALKQSSGSQVKGVHIVGGGSQNTYLNQATANAAGLPVKAGPIEATAIGNLLAQAIAGGQFENVEAARKYVLEHSEIAVYEPQDQDQWQKAKLDYQQLEK